jgi:hypothetical protein
MTEVVILLFVTVGFNAEQMFDRVIAVVQLVHIFKLRILDADSSVGSAFDASDGDAEAYICQKELSH